MTTAILACEILKHEVEAAWEKVNCSFPIVYIDGGLHAYPSRLRKEIEKKLQELPPEVDTVLLAMALCGNAIVGFSAPCRLVVPRMDDCVTIFLHQDDERHANLKEIGHMYLSYGYINVKNFIQDEYDSALEKFGPRRCEKLTRMLYKDYVSVDIMENGTYDAHDKDFLAKVEKVAAIMECPYRHVPASNLILEKLFAGRWDQQFMVVEKGQILQTEQFF
ncbi:MAG: DUF1638 domain-containing protein [Firmicutes bacterium]|nr:DUF1638 domain-containing protein [Bacillota bacterium]